MRNEDAVKALERRLEAALANPPRLGAGFEASVLRRIAAPRVPWWPEALDLAGAASLLWIGALVMRHLG